MIRLFRKIRRNPINFLLGQFSLVLGILSCMIIFSFVSFHESYDSFYDDSNQIYRILRTENSNRTIALTEGTLKGKLQANYAEVPITHFMKTPVDITFEFDQKVILLENGLLTDQEFFSVFSCETVSGNIKDFLSKPNSLVLTRSVAEKLFGISKTGIGEIVHIQMGPNKIPLTVTGIIEDNASNSSLEFTYVLYSPSIPFWNDENPLTVFNTFIKTKNLSELSSINTYLNSNRGQDIIYETQNLTEIHLRDGIEFDPFNKFERNYLTILISIGSLIFLITLFNFFNLFYTLTLSRIREITTRKILGSSNFWIFKLLYGEIGIAMLSSILVSLILIYIFNNNIVDFFGFSPIQFYEIKTIAKILMAAFLIAGVFILLITSQVLRQNTQLGLKGKVTNGKLGFNLGKLLLTMQLIVTIFSISYGLVISEQTNFLKNIDVGYTYENIVTLKRPDNVDFSTWKYLQKNLEQHASIQSTGLAVFPSIGEYNFIRLKNLQTQEEYRLYWIGVDSDYIPTMEIDLISGRNFDSKLKSDEQAIIINEKALTHIGGEMALDNKFEFRQKPFKVIGIVRDFNHESLKAEVQPMMMTLNNPMAFRHMTVRYLGLTQSQMAELVNRECRELNIASNLTLTFMENDYNQKLLAEENVLSTVTKGFSIIAILISLIGLITYFNFILNQKKKDFSIRKVLGARLIDNFNSMMKPQVVNLTLAIIIAIPTSLYLLIEWKRQFIYQLNLNLFHLLLPVITILIIITLISFSFSILIDRQNPITNLKNE